MSVKILEVNQDNNGRRLDNYLISVFKNIPKSKIYNIIRKGEVRINSGRVKPNKKIKTGDLIRIPPYLDNIDKNIVVIFIALRTGSSGELCAYQTSYVPQPGYRGSGSRRLSGRRAG